MLAAKSTVNMLALVLPFVDHHNSVKENLVILDKKVRNEVSSVAGSSSLFWKMQPLSLGMRNILYNDRI